MPSATIPSTWRCKAQHLDITYFKITPNCHASSNSKNTHFCHGLLAAISNERDFDVVARAVRDAIEKNEPESGLDRLHTFVVKYVRALCTDRGLPVTKEKPLHSLFGEYVKSIQGSGLIESEMTLRILKSSISILEAFNGVRNNRSLAHDNPILNYDEALLIFNHVASSVRFLTTLERKLQIQRRVQEQASVEISDDDIPF